jgi:trehalose synthase-fused probable maltokinase
MQPKPKPSAREDLLTNLPTFLSQQRWFGGKARGISSIELLDVIPMADNRVSADLVLASVHYADQYPDEIYAVPLLSPVSRGVAPDLSGSGRQLLGSGSHSALQDALLNTDFLALLLEAVDQERAYTGGSGQVRAASTTAYRRGSHQNPDELQPALLKAEQSNSSILYDQRFILKLLRQASEGVNPELEIGRFLTERTGFAQVPALAGWIVYEKSGAGPRTLGILQAFVPNQGNAWDHTLRALNEFLTRAVRSEAWELFSTPHQQASPQRSEEECPPSVEEALFGQYLHSAALLGRRTAELHIALASDLMDPDFAPEPFSKSHQGAVQDSMLKQCERAFDLLRGHLNVLPEATRQRAEILLKLQGDVEQRLRSFTESVSDGSRIRVHGDYHLGQVLWANGDFVIIDFEGEPARPLAERRVKHSPLVDVAGMLRSFHYAAHKGFQDWAASNAASPEAASSWQACVRYWRQSSCSHFLAAYTQSARQASFLPSSPRAMQALLDIYLLNKAAYELGYELNNRPDWVSTPLEGILEILGK